MFKNKRLEQLETEKIIDKDLKGRVKDCSEQIAEVLLLQRELNRKLATENYNSTMFDWVRKTRINLDIVDQVQKDYIAYSMDPNKTSCSHLPKITFLLQKILKSYQ